VRKRAEIRRYFEKGDKNKDGKLTKEEWYNVLNSAGVKTSMQEVETFFENMDRDFDGRLSFEEFMGEETYLEKLFKKFDTNGDGYVTKQVRTHFQPAEKKRLKDFDNATKDFQYRKT